jgi:hypothetical protein
MRDKLFLTGTICAALVFGMITAGCDTGTGGSTDAKIIQITGITGLPNDSITIMLADAIGDNARTPAGGTGTIENQQATIYLKTMSGQTIMTDQLTATGEYINNNWTGNGAYIVLLWNASSPSEPRYLYAGGARKITIFQAFTQIPFSDFIKE